MSFELLVLLAVFVVLPLLQQLVGAWRQRSREAAGPGARRVPPLPTQPPPLPPIPSDDEDLLLPDGLAPSVSLSTAARQAPPARALRRPTLVVPQEHLRRHYLGAARGDRLSLRRAMLLVAILGPCRANQPYDGPGSSGQLTL